jgi:predicted metal-binding membrane protein
MLIAMILVMAPLIMPNVRFVSRRSPGRSRLRASVEVTLGWAAVWATAAIALATLSTLSHRVLPRPAVLGMVLVTAVCWQLSPRRARRVVRCHRTFAPPLVGGAASRARLRFGAGLGADCAGSCWALMWLMDVAGHSLLVMVPLFWVSWYERFRRPHHDLRTRTTAGVVAAVGLGFLSATAWPHLG